MRTNRRTAPARSGIRPAHLVLALAAALALAGEQPAGAQALNDEIERLLDNNCAALQAMRASQGESEFGPELAAICEFPTTSGAASSGGGAAAVHSSTVSIQNSLLQRRRARAKAAAEEPGASADSWRFLERESAVALLALGDGAAPLAGGDAQAAGESGIDSRRLGLFVSGLAESLDRDLTQFEDGYDSSISGATVGIDYRFTNRFLGGLVATFLEQDGDFDGGGEFEMKSVDPTLFASIQPTERTFVQIVAGSRSQEFDVRRAVLFTIERQGGGGTTELSGVAASGTDATVRTGGVQFGYDHSVGSFTFGPRLGLNYSRTTIDAYAESGQTGLELRVGEQEVKSRQGVVGFYGAVALSGGGGVWVPQLNLEFVQEFEDSTERLRAQLAQDLRGADATTFVYQANDPDTSFFNVEVGVAAVFAHGIQPYVNLRTLLGNAHFDNLAGTFGIRFEI
jgi:outer membrane autotransporter protein